MIRIQENILAKPERRLLTWICALLPAWIKPDGLTAFGFAGAVLVCLGGVLSNHAAAWLALIAIGLVINWVGDSLDGSLARFRNITRPRYGYFLDHSVDGLNNLLILTGLGLTASIRLSVALLALCGYYLLCIYVFLRRQVFGELQLSFMFMGPTELRLIMLLMTVGIFFRPQAGVIVAARLLTVYEMILIFAAMAFVTIFTWFVLKTAHQLRCEEQTQADTKLSQGDIS